VSLFDQDSLNMASIQSLSIIGVLVALVPAASVAMPQDVPAEVKSCKAISDDRERLKCFDGLFGGPSKSQTPLEEKQVKEPAEKKQVKESSEEKQGNWSIDESKSPTDGSPQVVAANLVNDIVLILRCKEQTTEAAFSTKYNYLGYKSVDVQLRIDDQNPIKQVWKASMDGRAAFAPDAIAFIQSLPDNGKLSLKATRSTDQKVKEGSFDLGAVSEVRSKIAKACDWDNEPVDEPVGSIDHQEKR
jgi:type VI secretion system VasI family protein